MRVFLTLICLVALFIGTCSEGVKPILTDFQIHFKLNPQPTWSDLWQLYTFKSKTFIIQKIGHFWVLYTSLLMTNFGRNRTGVIYWLWRSDRTGTTLFNRDARILDMLINANWCMSSLLSMQKFQKQIYRLA